MTTIQFYFILMDYMVANNTDRVTLPDIRHHIKSTGYDMRITELFQLLNKLGDDEIIIVRQNSNHKWEIVMKQGTNNV